MYGPSTYAGHITTLIVAYRQYTYVSVLDRTTFSGLFGQQVMANIVSICDILKTKRWDLTKPLFRVGANTRQEV